MFLKILTLIYVLGGLLNLIGAASGEVEVTITTPEFKLVGGIIQLLMALMLIFWAGAFS